MSDLDKARAIVESTEGKPGEWHGCRLPEHGWQLMPAELTGGPPGTRCWLAPGNVEADFVLVHIVGIGPYLFFRFHESDQQLACPAPLAARALQWAEANGIPYPTQDAPPEVQ